MAWVNRLVAIALLCGLSVQFLFFLLPGDAIVHTGIAPLLFAAAVACFFHTFLFFTVLPVCAVPTPPKRRLHVLVKGAVLTLILIGMAVFLAMAIATAFGVSSMSALMAGASAFDITSGSPSLRALAISPVGTFLMGLSYAGGATFGSGLLVMLAIRMHPETRLLYEHHRHAILLAAIVSALITINIMIYAMPRVDYSLAVTLGAMLGTLPMSGVMLRFYPARKTMPA